MHRSTHHDLPGVTAAFPRILLALLEDRGLNGQALLKDLGLDATALASPEGRVSPRQYAGLAAGALELSGDPGLGLQLALRTPPTAHGNLGVAMMSSATLGDAMQLALRYMPLLQSNLPLHLQLDADRVTLSLGNDVPLPAPLHRYFSEAMLFGVFRSATWILGCQDLDCELHFDFPAPEPLPACLPTCRYDQPHCQISFAPDLLALPLPMADSATRARAIEHCEREAALYGAPTAGLCSRVRQELERSPQCPPNLAQVAARLHLSERSLKRHLQAAGTSFRLLLTAVRQQQARQLLKHGEVPLHRIAEQLGYTDPSNFTRAFKRWTGKTPSALRRTQSERGRT